MATQMTPQDFTDAKPIADKLIALLTAEGRRPPTAVAAAAVALAAVAHLAECGPDAARGLFDHFYKQLENALKEG